MSCAVISTLVLCKILSFDKFFFNVLHKVNSPSEEMVGWSFSKAIANLSLDFVNEKRSKDDNQYFIHFH